MYEYPFGNGQQLNLDWFLAEWKNLLAAWEAEKNGIAGALDAEIAKAEAALADVFAARDAAAQSATAAGNSADAAAQSATDASGYLATVRADANTASNAAQNAAQSESNAADSAQTAVASKNAAGQSERNAAQSEANANSSKNAAAQSAADADASKSAAAQSAADADASKSAAAQSAEDAEDAAASVEASAQQISTNTTDINNLNWNKASAIYGTSSGEIASFNDGSNNLPVKITDISSDATRIFVFGYNLLLNEAESGRFGDADITINDDGTFTVTNKPGNGWCSMPLTATPILLKAGTYTIAEYDGAQVNENTALNVFSGSTNILNTRYSKVQNLVLSQDTEITVTFSVSYARIDQPIYGIIAKGAIDETGINYHNITQLCNKSIGAIVTPNTEIFSKDGVNNIWTDNGQISVEYIVNTKMYIDNKIAELQATLLENIGG